MLRRTLLLVTLLSGLLPAAAAAQSVVEDNPAATSSAPGRFDVAARAPDGTVLVRSLDTATGTWTDWTPVGGISATSGPALGADDDGTLHVFTRAGAASGVFESVLTGGSWSAWSEPTSGTLLTGPSTTNRVGSTELDLTTIGTNGGFYHTFRTAPGAGFGAFGRINTETGTTTPGIISRAASHLDAFTRAADGTVTNFRYVPSQGWTTGTAGGGAVTSAITAITRSDAQMDIYARWSDGSIRGQTFDGTNWLGWLDLGTTAGTSAPAAATTGGGRVDLVTRDATTLYHSAFTPGVGWSPFTTVGPIATPVDRGAVNGAGGGDGARIALVLRGTTKTARTYRFGRRVTVDGGLVNAAGAPVTGATIGLRATNLASGAAPQPLATVTTGPDGRFSHTFKAGPGRTVEASYVAYANDGAAATAATVKARSRASATLKVSRKSVRRGQRVRFTGRLRGGAVPNRGKLVALQAYQRGRWRTFETPRAGRKGRFSARYRFQVAPRKRTRLRFRAVIPTDGSYPFTRGTSSVRRVLLRP